MNSAVIESSEIAQIGNQYTVVASEMLDFRTNFSSLFLQNGRAIAFVVGGGLAMSNLASPSVQSVTQPTVGQVMSTNTSTLIAMTSQALPQAMIRLTAEEHQVFRDAIMDSAEIVHEGFYVEDL